MNKLQVQPRTLNFFGKRVEAARIGETWLEPSEICFPAGGMTRRAKVEFEDHSLGIVWCGVSDTFFSIPATATINGETVRGFITSDEHAFYFHADKA